MASCPAAVNHSLIFTYFRAKESFQLRGHAELLTAKMMTVLCPSPLNFCLSLASSFSISLYAACIRTVPAMTATVSNPQPCTHGFATSSSSGISVTSVGIYFNSLEFHKAFIL